MLSSDEKSNRFNIVLVPGTHISGMLWGQIPLYYRARNLEGRNVLLNVINTFNPVEHHTLELTDMVKAVRSYGKRLFPGDLVSRVFSEIRGDVGRVCGLSEDDQQCWAAGTFNANNGGLGLNVTKESFRIKVNNINP